jgi:signal transduction histidine kinase
LIKANRHTINGKIKLINIEKEFILNNIKEEFSFLFDEINDVINALDSYLSQTNMNYGQHTNELKLRVDGIKKAIKSLIELNTFEHSSDNSLDQCNLGSILEKMLPLLKIYGQDKNVIIKSSIVPSLRINGNSRQLRSVFKQLLYLLIKEFETGGKIELSEQQEKQYVIITINIYGTLKFEISYEKTLSPEELFSQKFLWKTQVTKLYFISNTLKQNRSRITVRKLSSFHRIISIILPTNDFQLNR